MRQEFNCHCTQAACTHSQSCSKLCLGRHQCPQHFTTNPVFAMVSSMVRNEMCVELAGFGARTRFWSVGAAEPGSGKAPAMIPLRDLLFKVCVGDAELAPGGMASRFHTQEGAARWAALDRLKPSQRYLLIASAEATPCFAPTWPTQGNWNQSTHTNYQRFLDAANGGPIPWETKHDRSSVSHEEHTEEDAEATGGFDRTNATVCCPASEMVSQVVGTFRRHMPRRPVQRISARRRNGSTTWPPEIPRVGRPSRFQNHP